MTAEVLDFPHRDRGEPVGRGPTGPLMDEIKAEEERLSDLLDDFPYGSEFDPRAGVSEQTLEELPFAVRMLREANNLIELASKREAKYCLGNGWPAPKDN